MCLLFPAGLGIFGSERDTYTESYYCWSSLSWDGEVKNTVFFLFSEFFPLYCVVGLDST